MGDRGAETVAVVFQIIRNFAGVKWNGMDNNFKIKIDALVDEINTVTDLIRKIEILNYMEQQSSFMLWQLEEEKRIDDDSRDY